MNASGTAIFVWSVYSGGTYTVYSQRFNNSTGAAIDSAPVSLFSGTAYPTPFGGHRRQRRLRGQLLQHRQHLHGLRTGLQRQQRAAVGQPDHRGFGDQPESIASRLSVAGDGSFVVDWDELCQRQLPDPSPALYGHGRLRDTSTPLQVLARRAGTSAERRCRTSRRQFRRRLGAICGSSYQSGCDVSTRRPAGAAAVQVSRLERHERPVVAVDSQGDFGVEWTNGSTAPNIWGRFYNASSQPESDAFLIDVGDPGYGYGGHQPWQPMPKETSRPSGQSNSGRQLRDPHPAPATQPGAGQHGQHPDRQRALERCPTTINLANYFSDLDIPYRDSLSYSVTGNTNAAWFPPASAAARSL